MQRRTGQRGNAILEAGLVLTALMVFVCGIIDVSMVLFIKNTISHATREGARYAITMRTEPDMCQEASIKQVVQRQSMGFLSSSANAARIQVNFYDPQTFAASNNRAGNVVKVSVDSLPWSWIVPFGHMTGPATLSATSSDVLEAPANGVTPCR
jgi:Flp pilus assembly protein TadG